MPKAFISYRRDDSTDITGRICDRLTRRFGRDAVFIDVDDIALGEDFPERLNRELDGCDVVIAVIGPKWAGPTSGDPGRRRIDDPADFVRVEIEWAIDHGIPIVPVLIGGVLMPEPKALPETIRDLSSRNALDVRSGPPFARDVAALIERLEPHLGVGAAISHDSEIERRRATVMFIDVALAPDRRRALDPEEALSILDGCAKLVEALILRYGGAVLSRVGLRIKASFGAPVALEGAARTAVNSAIAIRNGADRYTRENQLASVPRLRIGIESGFVISQRARDRLDVIGDVVEMAERLCEAASAREVLLGTEAHRQTKQEFQFGEPAGKAGLAPTGARALTSDREYVYRPKAAADSPLVGRTKDLGEIERHIKATREGRGHVVKLIGEAGVGKSRLVAELAERSRDDGVIWLEGRCLSIGGNLSFHPFADLLRSWAELSGEEDDVSVAAQLEIAVQKLFGEKPSDVLPFVVALLGVRPTGEIGRRIDAIEGDGMQKLIVRAMIRLFRRLAERSPLVIVIEDVHWADESSLDLLYALLRLVIDHQILFMLVSRPDTSNVLESLARATLRVPTEQRAEYVLAPLQRDASETMIANLLGSGVPHSMFRALEERTGGNPFYIEQVVLCLAEEGTIELRDGSYHVVDATRPLVVPTTVREVIAARVDRLDVPSRRIIQIISILGRGAYVEIIEHVLGQLGTVESVTEGLEHLADDQFLMIRRMRAGRIVYEFKHALIQEVVYEAISLERRRDDHRRVARAIEETFTEAQPDFYGMLAYHFVLGRDLERAEEYLLKAGEVAGRLAASSAEALHFFREASRIFLESRGEDEGREKRALLEKRIALTFFNRGRMGEGDEHFAKSLKLLDIRVPRHGALRNLHHADTLMRVLFDLHFVRDRSRRVAATDRNREVVDLMFRGAQAQVTTNPAAFVFDTLEGLRRVNRVNPRTVPRCGAVYAGIGGAVAYSGLSFFVAEKLIELGTSLANPQDTREVFVCRLMNFMEKLLCGDWDESHTVERALVDENESLGELWNVMNCIPLQAKKLAHQGRFSEAAEILERIEKIGDHYDYELARSNELAVRMFLLLEQRHLDEAHAVAHAYYEGFDEELLNLLALGTRAKIEILLERIRDAETTLATCAAIAGRTRLPPPFQISSYTMARFFLHVRQLEESLQGDRSGAGRHRRNAKRSGRQARRMAAKVAWHRPEYQRLAGTLAWLEARKSKACAAWLRSCEQAESLGMRPELGRTYLEVGKRLAEEGIGRCVEGADASQWLDRAELVFRDCGLGWDTRKLEAIRQTAGGH